MTIQHAHDIWRALTHTRFFFVANSSVRALDGLLFQPFSNVELCLTIKGALFQANTSKAYLGRSTWG